MVKINLHKQEWLILMVNVGQETIHGSCGLRLTWIKGHTLNEILVA